MTAQHRAVLVVEFDAPIADPHVVQRVAEATREALAAAQVEPALVTVAVREVADAVVAALGDPP